MNASKEIDQKIVELSDWRGEVYAKLRQIVREADPTLKEEVKWGAAVYTKKGNICSIGAMKEHVKINFFNGANIPDTKKIFNNGLESKNSRAIDYFENDNVNEAAVKKFIQAAVLVNN